LFAGNKPHSCHICPKRFALACNLRAHLKTHQEEDDNTSLLMESQTEEEESEQLQEVLN